MKTKLLTLTLLFFSLLNANGQQDSLRLKKNAIYFEGLGNGFFYSINYEGMLYQKNVMHLSTRVGVGYVPGCCGDLVFWDPFLTLPGGLKTQCRTQCKK